jgi:hypothetical protein
MPCGKLKPPQSGLSAHLALQAASDPARSNYGGARAAAGGAGRDAGAGSEGPRGVAAAAGRERNGPRGARRRGRMGSRASPMPDGPPTRVISDSHPSGWVYGGGGGKKGTYG